MVVGVSWVVCVQLSFIFLIHFSSRRHVFSASSLVASRTSPADESWTTEALNPPVIAPPESHCNYWWFVHFRYRLRVIRDDIVDLLNDFSCGVVTEEVDGGDERHVRFSPWADVSDGSSVYQELELIWFNPVIFQEFESRTARVPEWWASPFCATFCSCQSWFLII